MIYTLILTFSLFEASYSGMFFLTNTRILILHFLRVFSIYSLFL